MQAKFGNSKSHRNISHYAFPNLYVDQKTTGRLPVAATARRVFIRFRRHHDFQYRIQIAGCFLLTRPLPLTRNRCPAWLPAG